MAGVLVFGNSCFKCMEVDVRSIDGDVKKDDMSLVGGGKMPPPPPQIAF